jgi:hypothetical protein
MTKTKKKKEEKKELSPKEIAWSVFLEDYDDPEIEKRYEGFIKNLEWKKKRHDDLVGPLDETIEEYEALGEILSGLVKQGHFSYENDTLIPKLKELEKKADEMRVEIMGLKADFNKEHTLIKKYEDAAENKLFYHWRYLKAFDPEVPVWTEFRAKWSKIF